MTVPTSASFVELLRSQHSCSERSLTSGADTHPKREQEKADRGDAQKNSDSQNRIHADGGGDSSSAKLEVMIHMGRRARRKTKNEAKRERDMVNGRKHPEIFLKKLWNEMLEEIKEDSKER